MSIAEEGKNINSPEEKSLLVKLGPFLLLISAILGVGGSIGLGILWDRVNMPAPIIIQCSDEVMKGLTATSTIPIPAIKTPKKGSPAPKKKEKPKVTVPVKK